ncbi:MAG: M48 family metalloprotease [Candidatus Omnitrophica bacterium]|nr:M48 family metalloprotease [Candidatus Omnitrophota bacterium]
MRMKLKLSRQILAIIIACFFLMQAALAANVRIQNPPKELPLHLVKLQNELIDDVEKIEEVIYQRGALYRDKEVENYLNKIAEKIAPDVPLDKKRKFSIKIIRDPAVNAFALPNGSIYIHTGTLAKLENEAQLAFLMGHEMSHVVHRDSVYHVNSVHNKTIVYKLFDIALAPTSVFFGILGDLVQLGFGILHVATVTGYSREIEARADEDGILWASEKGYHPRKAAVIMEIFLKEKEKYQTGPEVYFLMNHPSTERRLKKVNAIIREKYGKSPEGEIKEEEFLTTMSKVKVYNASLNIKMDRLEHAMENIEWVMTKFPHSPKAHYVAGEIHRLKSENKNRLEYELNAKNWRELNKGRKKGELEKIWREKAIEEYKTAITCDPVYADSYKGLGLLYYDMEDEESAMANFNKYLEIEPDAVDKRYVTSFLKRIEADKKADEKHN